MVPTVGTVLSLIPASGQVLFTSDGERWTEPLIGYAVVVTWTKASDPSGSATWAEEYESGVEPVVLQDGQPTVVSAYVSGRVTWAVIAPGTEDIEVS